MDLLYSVKKSLRHITPQSKAEKEAAYVLRQRISSLPNLPEDSRNSWIENRLMLRKLILEKDPRFFLTWDVIQKTMFHNARDAEFEFLKKKGFLDTWREALIGSEIGNPKPYKQMRKSDGNLIHQAYHISRLREYTNLNPQSVIEFGGGYGSMAGFLRKLGLGENYIILDFPEFLALQKYYLSLLGQSMQFAHNSQSGNNQVTLVDSISELKQISAKNKQTDLCIALWSVSESPIEIRRQFLDSIGKPSAFLIAFQKSFDNNDNVNFFRDFQKSRPDLHWHSSEITHLPGNYYLIGM